MEIVFPTASSKTIAETNPLPAVTRFGGTKTLVLPRQDVYIVLLFRLRSLFKCGGRDTQRNGERERTAVFKQIEGHESAYFVLCRCDVNEAPKAGTGKTWVGFWAFVFAEDGSALCAVFGNGEGPKRAFCFGEVTLSGTEIRTKLRRLLGTNQTMRMQSSFSKIMKGLLSLCRINERLNTIYLKKTLFLTA